MRPVPTRPDEIDSYPDHFPDWKNRLFDSVIWVRLRSRFSPVYSIVRCVKEEEEENVVPWSASMWSASALGSSAGANPTRGCNEFELTQMNWIVYGWFRQRRIMLDPFPGARRGRLVWFGLWLIRPCPHLTIVCLKAYCKYSLHLLF